MIDLAVLGLLSESDLHGYELKKRLREIMGPLSSVSFGSLYPALARLERDGLVEAVMLGAVDHSSPSIPMTGSLSGEAAAFRATRLRSVRGSRNKKVYAISPAGRARLGELIADPSGDERNFNLKLAFCRWTEPEVRLTLLERRRAALVECLSEGRRSIVAGSERIDRYVRSLMEHHTESTERDIAWVDRLIAAERMTAEPMTREPMTREPMTREPMTREPMTREPMAAARTTVEPMAAEPMAAEHAGRPVESQTIGGKP